MREIKFRAFSTVNNNMWPVRSVLEPRKYTPNGSVKLARENNPSDDGEVDVRLVKLMQYTGLTDRHGVDIFEGDIIKYAYRDYTVVVKPLERGRYSAFWDFSDFLDPSDNELGAEVIGNIYEHPHLLEDKK